MKILNISGNNIGLSGLQTLLYGLNNLPKLESLDISYNEIGYDGGYGANLISFAFRAGKLPNLKILNISGNNIGYRVLKQLLSPQVKLINKTI